MKKPQHNAVLQEIGRLWRSEQRAEARAAIAGAVANDPTNATLLGLAGLLACQDGDPEGGVPLLRRALAADPSDHASRTNLLTALVTLDRIDDAAVEGVLADQANPRVARLLGYVAQRRDRQSDAIRLYGVVVDADPADAESWNNLGNAYAATGDLANAMVAFDRAVRLRRHDPAPRVNAAKALAEAARHTERLKWMRRAVADIPEAREVQVEAGLAEAAERQFDAAETAFRKAIALDPRHAEAYLELGLLLENLNRIDDLETLVAQASTAGIAPDEIALIAAWLARRRGAWELAAERASRVDDAILPLRRHHLLADVADRLGNVATAFAEFEAMNAAARAGAPAETGPSYRDEVAAQAEMLARDGIKAVGPVARDRSRAAPTFIIGFPRSGTTLLDTLLMNDPRFHVLEELPILPLAEEEARRLGGDLTADADYLRAFYFDQLDRIAPAPAGTHVIDKNPLHLGRLPLLHRLFPDAKVVLVERHPCDVVLSCFMANFQLNHAMRHFTSLSDAAALYDTVFSHFEISSTMLPITLHRIRYERMVEDLEGEMRPLMTFLDFSWTPAVLDNQGIAAVRGHIRTASYSQVTEPIYRRAAGRWERYRAYLAGVLPILAPWCERMHYPID